ncbi:LysM domain-containing protein [Ensifer sp.]|jgi:hypothetical protein|uniref:LysM domain-containing protein n=1 Tax=Ensifer sp. TaxID=1872086 RepID=UPI002E126AC4|nr:LysM domain-containing protein [Ensifer sp.]
MIDPRTFAGFSLDGVPDPFPENSRYRGLGRRVLVDENGNETVYLARRIVPSPERFVEVGQIEVKEDDRIDNIAADQIGDPELYWRLADANGALNPAELTERNGRKLRITLPEGIPGPSEDER